MLVRGRYKLSNLYDNDATASVCAYCGVYADTRDHVLPIVFMEFLISHKETETFSEIVPACRECNSVAGSRVFPSFKKKKQFVQAKIFGKYSRIVEWTQD